MYVLFVCVYVCACTFFNGHISARGRNIWERFLKCPNEGVSLSVKRALYKQTSFDWACLSPSPRPPALPALTSDSFLLSGCLEELWRSGQRLRSEEWAWGFDLWLAPGPARLLWVTETEPWPPTERGPALRRSWRRVGCCPALTKGELCRGGEKQWDSLRGGGEDSSIPTISTLLWKPALLNRIYSVKKWRGFPRVEEFLISCHWGRKKFTSFF